MKLLKLLNLPSLCPLCKASSRSGNRNLVGLLTYNVDDAWVGVGKAPTFL